eukprot:TRINITY_DN28459_c0_g1_i1.p1 TRINITY_DN28459_c0_g1~~TRINITY_DN28459_c0_g1_i1.p1  ORF type:complete len:125 (-),score=22.72 TRINITY_DN28459_c0_g1_i1:19-393(-)
MDMYQGFPLRQSALTIMDPREPAWIRSTSLFEAEAYPLPNLLPIRPPPGLEPPGYDNMAMASRAFDQRSVKLSYDAPKLKTNEEGRTKSNYLERLRQSGNQLVTSLNQEHNMKPRRSKKNRQFI